MTDIDPVNMSADQYRLLVDAITDYGIYMLTPEGRISSWNAGARRFKGYVEKEVLGQHFSMFYPPEDRERGMPMRALEIARRRNRAALRPKAGDCARTVRGSGFTPSLIRSGAPMGN